MTFDLDFEHHLRFWLGLYEQEIASAIRSFATPGTVAFNVGADIGFQALAVARLSRASVVAFEPREDAVKAIRRNLELNPDLADSVHIVQAPVGSGGQLAGHTLDDYIAAQPHHSPGFVLIDVDGSEVDVLHGARSLLRRRRPDIIIETHSQELERQCIAILADAGYAPEVVEQRRFFPDYRPIPHNRWLVASGGA